jgi:O-methyltransferase domain
MSDRETAPMLPANVRVFELAAAVVCARAVWAAAELGVADHLEDTPRTADELAAATGSHGEALYRILRLLAAHGVFEELDGRRFQHSDMSRALRTDHPAKARAAVRMLGSDGMYRAFGALRTSLTTGAPAWDAAMGEPIFDFLAHEPDAATLFNDAMIGIHGGEPPAVALAYPFAGTVIDVGGGSGNMLVNVLRQHPDVRGVVYDLPHVVVEAQRRLEAEGLATRARVEGGSFFGGVPAGGNAYILSHIIHDWDEARCVRILSHCREAKAAGGKVLIVEMVVPPPNVPHPAKMLDIVMLAVPGGRERTADEYRALLAKAGLRLTRVIPTASPVSVIEAE